MVPKRCTHAFSAGLPYYKNTFKQVFLWVRVGTAYLEMKMTKV